MRNFIWILLLAFVFTALGCKRVDYKRGDKNTTLVTELTVRVKHPTLGYGPNFMVNLYDDQAALDAKIKNQAVVSDVLGYAYFTKAPIGSRIITCYIPGEPSYYAIDTIYIDARIENYTELFLQQQ